MRAILLAVSLAWTLAAAPQDKPAEPKKVGPTAEEIIEKSLEASGGRAAMEKLTSTVAKGSLEMGATGMKATMEFYAKAPNKRLIVTSIEGFGEIRQGFDGKIGWSQDPQRGIVEVTGEQLANLQRESTFNAALKWKELYPKVEMTGKEKVGERDTYVLKLTPTTGKPVTQYIDAQNYQLARQISTQDTPQGPMEITVDFSDFRDIGDGIKAPFQLKQVLPMGEITVKMTEMKNNVAIEDTRFAKPAAQ